MNLEQNSRKKVKIIFYFNIVVAALVAATLLKTVIPPDNVDLQEYRIKWFSFGLVLSYLAMAAFPFLCGIILSGIMHIFSKSNFWSRTIKITFITWVLFVIAVVIQISQMPGRN